jgi:miniconductance mechanosensitive channel
MEKTSYISNVSEYLKQSPMVSGTISFGIILVVAFIANFIVKKILLRLLEKLLKYTSYGRETDDMLRTISRLANIIPAIIIMGGIQFVPHLSGTLTTVVRNVGGAFIVITFAMALNNLLDVVNSIYMRRPGAYNKPIKGYLQVVKIVVSVIACILALAALVDKSPLILLSGLGAMAAVTMLVFQDTILSLVASVQITSSNIVKLGDWIEMPQLNADGDVIDIALHTVKVQNWDKTITTIPTRRLVSDTFKNWRGMREAGGRRIKRSIYLDQNSIHFLTDDEEEHLKKFTLLKEYLFRKDKELTDWNSERKNEDSLNARRLTNVGTFRAYLEQYLKNHPRVHQNMTMIVRQLSPGATGLPIEVYCFANTVIWVEYEGIQSDIFDHIYAILPEFGLRTFQNPGGYDFARMQICAKN